MPSGVWTHDLFECGLWYRYAFHCLCPACVFYESLSRLRGTYSTDDNGVQARRAGQGAYSEYLCAPCNYPMTCFSNGLYLLSSALSCLRFAPDVIQSRLGCECCGDCCDEGYDEEDYHPHGTTHNGSSSHDDGDGFMEGDGTCCDDSTADVTSMLYWTGLVCCLPYICPVLLTCPIRRAVQSEVSISNRRHESCCSSVLHSLAWPCAMEQVLQTQRKYDDEVDSQTAKYVLNASNSLL